MYCIENLETIGKIGKLILLIHSQNTDKIKDWLQTEENADIKRILEFYIENLETYIPKTEDKRQITIPDGLGFGIEIECGGQYSDLLTKCAKPKSPDEGTKKFGEWTTGIDGSGVEFASPVLDNNEKSTTEIYRMCEFLQDIGQSVTEADGGHIHFSASYFEHQDGEPPFEMENAYLNLIEIYSNCEKIFYAISNRPGEAPRTDVVAAEPISRRFLSESIKETGRLSIKNI